MIEPKSPVTVKVRYSPYPAVLLVSDENYLLKPKSIVLRHRHLRQQQRVMQSSSNSAASSSRPTRGVIVGTVSQSADAPYSLNSGSVVPGAANAMPPLVSTELPAPGPVVVPAPVIVPAPVPAAALVAMPAPAAAQVVQPTLAPATTQPAVAGSSGQKGRSGPERLKDPAIVQPESAGHLVLTRGTHAIRSTAYKTTWWMTKARDYLCKPVAVPSAQVGDLYVHLASDARQAWLRAPSDEWISVEEKHAHPFLWDYLLRFLDNGEPRWVTKESFRTYNGRVKKAERDARSHSEDSS